MGHVRYKIIGFLVFRFHFETPFLTSDDPGSSDLQISTTSRVQNMKSMKISRVRYQIIDCLVFRFHSETPF